MSEFDGERYSRDAFEPIERAQHREMLDKFIPLYPNQHKLDRLIKSGPMIMKIAIAMGAFGASVAYGVEVGFWSD